MRKQQQQRQNYSKLLAQLIFLATTPENKMVGEDIPALSKEAGASSEAFLENPAIVGVFKMAQEEGLFDESSNLTKKGAAVAQTCLNAKPGGKYQVNFVEFFEQQKFSGMLAATAALVKNLQDRINYFNEELDGFKAEGRTKELFLEAGEFFMELGGVQLREIPEDLEDLSMDVEVEEE